MSTKVVPVGVQQIAMLTPNEGYEVESVTVINTVTNEEVPSELQKINDNPAQWKCTFKQPAGSVSIKPKVVPILYAVVIEECANCNIVLLEAEDAAAVEENITESNQETENEDKSNFNNPQHSFEDDAEEALDVGESVSEESNTEDVSEDAPEIEESSNTVDNTNGDKIYDGGEFEEEINQEPVLMTQAEYDRKNDLYWQWRNAAREGKCNKEEFEKIKKQHLQLQDDIYTGKVKIVESIS